MFELDDGFVQELDQLGAALVVVHDDFTTDIIFGRVDDDETHIEALFKRRVVKETLTRC